MAKWFDGYTGAPIVFSHECTPASIQACEKWVVENPLTALYVPWSPPHQHYYFDDYYIDPCNWISTSRIKLEPIVDRLLLYRGRIVYLDHFSERVFLGHTFLPDNFTCDYHRGGEVVRSDYQPNAGLHWGQTINFTYDCAGEYHYEYHSDDYHLEITLYSYVPYTEEESLSDCLYCAVRHQLHCTHMPAPRAVYADDADLAMIDAILLMGVLLLD